MQYSARGVRVGCPTQSQLSLCCMSMWLLRTGCVYEEELGDCGAAIASKCWQCSVRALIASCLRTTVADMMFLQHGDILVRLCPV